MSNELPSTEQGSLSALTASAKPSLDGGLAPHNPVPRFTPREITVIMIGVMLAMFLSGLDQTILGPAIPKISADFGGGKSTFWVMSSYLLGSTVATPIYGKLSDLYGRKRVLQFAITWFLTTSVFCAIAGSMATLIGFRLLQGLGGGGLLSMAFSIAGDVTAPRERGKYQAYLSAGFAMAAICGPTLGGIFADELSWRWAFWINIPIGLAALVMSELTLAKLTIRGVRHRIDYLGAVLIVTFATCVMLLMTLGGREFSWRSAEIETLCIAAAILLFLCIAHEQRTPEPMLPPQLFKNRTFVVSNMATFLNFSCQTGILAYLPTFLQLVYGVSAADSGLMMVPSLLILPIAGALMGYRISRTGRYKHFPLLGQVTSTAGALILFATGAATSHPVLILEMMLFSVGTGVGGVLILSLQNSIDRRDLGTGTAALMFFRSLGSSFGIALFGNIFIARADFMVGQLPVRDILGASPGVSLLQAGPAALMIIPDTARVAVADAILGAFHHVFLTAAGISILAFIVTLFLDEIPLQQTQGITVLPALEEASAVD